MAHSSQKIQHLGDYDVIVCGGGPAGVCAGLSAARSGLRTLLVEQMGCLGGTATSGLHQKIAVFMGSLGQGEIVHGIAREIADRAVREFDADWNPNGGNNGLYVEIENYKYLLDRLAEECKLEVLFFTRVDDAIVDGGRITGIEISNKSGRFIANAKIVIDCTGDADAAYRAGCRMMHGRDGDGKMQPVTIMYRVGGVDTQKARKYWGEDAQLKTFCQYAVQNGYMRPWQTQLMGFWFNSHRPGQVNVNFTHMHLDGSSAFDQTKAMIEGRKQVHEAVRAMRALVPGFDKSYLIDTASYPGVRETRRIYGEYVLTVDDIKNQTIFPDSIGLGGAYIDIHNTEGPGMDSKSGFTLPPGGYYSIPYRTLVPEKLDNLLVAGRCHSATHEAAGSTRWMAQCMVMGQAAGTAASLAVIDKIAPRKVDIGKLQAALMRDGARLK